MERVSQALNVDERVGKFTWFMLFIQDKLKLQVSEGVLGPKVELKMSLLS